MTARLVFGEQETSGTELDRRASALAGGLLASGLREGDVVAVLLRNGPVCIDVIGACRLASIFYCALNWHLAEAEIEFILRDSGARLLLADPGLLADCSVPEGITVVPTGPSYEAWLADQPAYAGSAVVPRAHMAYTSGTTGRPKGIRRLPTPLPDWPRAQCELRDVVREAMGVEEGCRALMPAPLYHSAPSLFVQNALQTCERLVLMDRFDPEETLALVARHRITLVYLVPIMYSRLLALPPEARARHDLSSLRFVASTGAPCAPEVKRAMIDWLGPVIHETYASSEAGLLTSINTAEALARPGSAGRPVGRASIRILHDDGSPCAPGQAGLIHVRQPATPDFTYNNNPEARAAIERDGHFTLGDIGYLDEDGYLFVRDRASDLVISGGVNIYPAEVEQALASLPEIADCAVFGVPDPAYGERLHAVAQLRPGASLAVESMIERLRGRIAGFKIPRSLDVVEALPRDANGKLLKRRLRDPFWAAAGRTI